MPLDSYLAEEMPSIPQLNVPERNGESFMRELRGFHSCFEDCFSRSEPRENFLRYMVGQFRKSKKITAVMSQPPIERGSLRSMQRFISDAVWEEDLMLKRYQGLIAEDMGDLDGVCVFAEACFQKKGDDSAGVARQYCHPLNKVLNCQIGVFAAYASRHGYAFLDKRLFVPDHWLSSAFASRRGKLKMSERSESKPQLAAEILGQLLEKGLLPFKYVVTDQVCGGPDLIDAVESHDGLVYLMCISADTLIWLDPGEGDTKESKGRIPSSRATTHNSTKPITALSFARNRNDFFWYRRRLPDGAEGAAEFEFTKARVVLPREVPTRRAEWLIVRRTLEDKPIYSFFVSNAPLNTKLSRFVWLSGMKGVIERCFEEARDDVGMYDYEVRKYPGWNHHMLICMLAHFFLRHMRIRLGDMGAIGCPVPDRRRFSS